MWEIIKWWWYGSALRVPSSTCRTVRMTCRRLACKAISWRRNPPIGQRKRILFNCGTNCVTIRPTFCSRPPRIVILHPEYYLLHQSHPQARVQGVSANALEMTTKCKFKSRDGGAACCLYPREYDSTCMSSIPLSQSGFARA